MGRILSRSCWRTAARARQQGASRQRCAPLSFKIRCRLLCLPVAHTFVFTCPATTVSTNFRRLNLKRGGGGSRIGAKVRSTRHGHWRLSLFSAHPTEIPFPTTHQTKFSRAYKKKNHKNYVGSDKCYKCGGTVREPGVGGSAKNRPPQPMASLLSMLSPATRPPSPHHIGALGQQVQVDTECATAHGKCVGMDCRRSRARYCRG
jgi:hypothetical protein